MNERDSSLEMRLLTEKWREIEITVEDWLRHRFNVHTKITVYHDQATTKLGTRSVVPVYDGNATLGVVVLDHHDYPISIMWVSDEDNSHTAV